MSFDPTHIYIHKRTKIATSGGIILIKCRGLKLKFLRKKKEKEEKDKKGEGKKREEREQSESKQ